MARKMTDEQEEAWDVLQADIVRLAKKHGWASKNPQGVNPSYAFTCLEHPDLPERLSASVPVDPDGANRYIYGSTVITGPQLQALLTTLTLPEPPQPEKKTRTRRTSAAHSAAYSAAHQDAPVPPTEDSSAAHTQEAVPPIAEPSAAHTDDGVPPILANSAAQTEIVDGPLYAALKAEFESTDPLSQLDTERLAFRDVKRHIRESVKIAANKDEQIYSQTQVYAAVREYADTALWSTLVSEMPDTVILKKVIGSSVTFLNRVSGRTDTASVSRATDKAKYPPHITGEVHTEDRDDRRILHFLDGAGFRSIAVGNIRSIG